MDEKKIITARTDSGKYMYAATEVEGTSWLVVSATPYSVIDGKVFSSSMFSIFASVILLILLAVMLYFMISKYLNPVTHVTGKIGDLSEGDFTAEMKTEGNNEITTLSEKLNGYISRMREMLLHLSGISDDMNESASNCMSISDGLTASNSSQSDSIEHLNACLEGLNRSIEDVASAAGDLAATSTALVDDSNKVRDLCGETVKSSEEGKAEMKNMTENFTTLNGTINDLIQIIHATSETVDHRNYKQHFVTDKSAVLKCFHRGGKSRRDGQRICSSCERGWFSCNPVNRSDSGYQCTCRDYYEEYHGYKYESR